MAFLLYFKDDDTKKYKRTVGFFFVLSFTRYIVLDSPTFFSHLPKCQSVSFQMVPRKCISLVQGLSYRKVRFWYVILGKNWKKGADP